MPELAVRPRGWFWLGCQHFQMCLAAFPIFEACLVQFAGFPTSKTMDTNPTNNLQKEADSLSGSSYWSAVNGSPRWPTEPLWQFVISKRRLFWRKPSYRMGNRWIVRIATYYCECTTSVLVDFLGESNNMFPKKRRLGLVSSQDKPFNESLAAAEPVGFDEEEASWALLLKRGHAAST